MRVGSKLKILFLLIEEDGFLAGNGAEKTKFYRKTMVVAPWCGSQPLSWYPKASHAKFCFWQPRFTFLQAK